MLQQDTLQVERWIGITEFPGYSVSDYGNVLNTDTGLQLKIGTNSHGVRMVGLMKNKKQHKRSLAVLVAKGFLNKPSNELFDTPIHLDGDRENCNVTNLMWRPLWFSRRYTRQFNDDHVTIDVPIEDVETGEQYKNSMHASVVNGLLDAELVVTMYNNLYVWPTGQVFRKVVFR